MLCKVADGSECQCIGAACVPIRLRELIKIIDVYVMPNLRHNLVLGVDFWRRMGIVPDMRKGEWYFSSGAVSSPELNALQSEYDLNPEDRQ